ncbi:MAG: amidohydrolase, partial [Deltaproteobacteria bacterium]
MNLEETALNYLSENESLLISLSKDIWDHPQAALRETYGSKQIADQLEKEGFSVRRGVAQMPTAFIASWGEGKPIIGILGEYDALPELSQKVSAEKEPIERGGPGHGCGHNLLGVGSLGAAVAVKRAMEKDDIEGTVRYYGCPAEETLVGKVFMARDGVFDDLDAAITWHPWYTNSVWWSSSNAMNSFKINFHGVAAHAGDAPEAGRSALDAVILTDVGVNYLREHTIQEARIHCVITNGGSVPNVVPAYAQIWYYVRAPRREQVEHIYQRVLDIAKGAALMTGTTSDVEFITGCYNYLQNDVIGEIMTEKMKKVGPPQFTDEDKTFAKQLIATLSPGEVEKSLGSFKLTREEAGDLCDKVFDQVGGLGMKGGVIGG